MNHKSIIKALAGVFCFSIFNSFLQIFIDFQFSPELVFICLYSVMTIHSIIYYGRVKKEARSLKAVKPFRPMRKKALHLRAVRPVNLRHKRILMGINIFLVFRHFDFSKR